MCWHSQINTRGVWTSPSFAKDMVLVSCQQIQECAEMRLLIFNLTEPNPMQDKSEGKLDVFPLFFLIEVFKFSKISHSRAFSGECVGEHCIHLHVNVSPLIIWLSPASLDRRGFHSLPVPFTARALKSKLTQTDAQMGSFFKQIKYWN